MRTAVEHSGTGIDSREVVTHMKRIAVLITSVALSFGGMTVVSPAAHACEGVDCFLACVAAAVNNPKDPVCPA